MARPSKYDPAFCDAVREFGKEGMGKAEIAAELEINRETLNEWCKLHPQFSDAIKSALDLSQGWWERKGREGAVGKVDGFNATGYIFQMKNRFRDEWNDTVKQEHTGKDGGPIETQDKGAGKLLAYLDAVSSRATGTTAE